MELAVDDIKIAKYPAYKDTGVKWIGEIPKHWILSRFRDIFSFSKGLNITKENLQDEGIPCVNYGEIHSKYGFEVDPNKHLLKCVREEYLQKSPKSLLHFGDFIFADTSEDIEGSGNFTYLNSYQTTFAGYHTVIARFERKDLNYRFLAYAIDSISFRNQIRSNVKGVKVYSITNAILKNTTLWFPPKEEQTAIAQFLDRKTAQIDKAIAQKERLIELLKERRQILIHKAVTKGLNWDLPDEGINGLTDNANPKIPKSKKSKFRHSGVEWIGEIPEHWEVKRLKYCLIGKLKYGANESGVQYDVNLPRYVRITDFGHDGKLSEDSKLSLTWKQGGDYLLKDGDILFARSGATVGKTYQFKKSMSTEENYCYAGYLIKAEPNEQIVLSDFLYLYTNSSLFNRWKDGVFNKATIENIGADKYSQLCVIIPHIEEQKQILERFNRDSKRFDSAISIKEQEIEKLKEYKATLINSAVTGKIKVV